MAFFTSKLDFAFPLFTDECAALCGGTGSGIGDCNKGEQPSNNQHGALGLLAVSKGIAMFCLVDVIADGGDDKVGAVGGNHGSLSEARSGIVLLHLRVDAQNGDENAKGEVEGYKELIEGASRASKESIKNAGKGDGEDIHRRRRPKQQPLPQH